MVTCSNTHIASWLATVDQYLSAGLIGIPRSPVRSRLLISSTLKCTRYYYVNSTSYTLIVISNSSLMYNFCCVSGILDGKTVGNPGIIIFCCSLPHLLLRFFLAAGSSTVMATILWYYLLYVTDLQGTAVRPLSWPPLDEHLVQDSYSLLPVQGAAGPEERCWRLLPCYCSTWVGIN